MKARLNRIIFLASIFFIFLSIFSWFASASSVPVEPPTDLAQAIKRCVAHLADIQVRSMEDFQKQQIARYGPSYKPTPISRSYAESLVASDCPGLVQCFTDFDSDENAKKIPEGYGHTGNGRHGIAWHEGISDLAKRCTCISGWVLQDGFCQKNSEEDSLKPNAKIVSITNDALVRHGTGKWEDLSQDMLLKEGDEISVGPLGSVVVEFQDKHRTTISSLTQIRIGTLLGSAQDRMKIEMMLILGRIRAQTPQQRTISTDFSIKSPTATTSIRGTEFVMQYNNETKETLVGVSFGTVEVIPENPSLFPATLGKGQEIVVTDAFSSGARPISEKTKYLFGNQFSGNKSNIMLYLIIFALIAIMVLVFFKKRIQI